MYPQMGGAQGDARLGRMTLTIGTPSTRSRRRTSVHQSRRRNLHREREHWVRSPLGSAE